MLHYSFLYMIIKLCSALCISLCILPPFACGHACGYISVHLARLSKSSALSKMGRLWALTLTPVIVMTSEFCQRGATVDTPFWTDLKTQTSPIECLVMLHIALVQKSQSRGREPCLLTPEPSFVPCFSCSNSDTFLSRMHCGKYFS